jgi:hypothetical protein
MAPSDVNNTARQDRASIREWYEDPSWVDLGHTIVSNTSTALLVSGDQTAHFTAGRAVRVNADNTYAGYISASAYSAPNTSITVTGTSLTTATSIQVGGPTSWKSSPNTGTITVSAVSSSGAVSATTGAFSGTITAAAATLSGNLTAASGIFSGTITAAGLSSTLVASLYPSGSVINSTYAEYTTDLDFTTTIPYDDSIPQNTEGTELLTASITPSSASNTIRIRVTAPLSLDDTSGVMTAALFVDSTANAIGVGSYAPKTTSPTLETLSFEVMHSPSTTSAVTYKLRAGSNSAEWGVNGTVAPGAGADRKYGGISRVTMVLEEIKA